MKYYLDEVIRKRENGLYICPLPTGYGKSYEIFRKIAELAKDENEHRKIIYITTLNKNLNVSELKSFFDNEEQYNQKVLHIPSIFDSVNSKLLEIQIPDEFKTVAYYDLKHSLERFNYTSYDGRIVEISGLIDKNGNVIKRSLDYIKTEDYE